MVVVEVIEVMEKVVVVVVMVLVGNTVVMDNTVEVMVVM